MSMQRSFFAILLMLLCSIQTVSAHLLDELNEFFLSQVWQVTGENGEEGNPYASPGTPLYEKDLTPEQQAARPQREPEKTLVLRPHEISFNDVVGQQEAVANLRGVVEQFRNPERLQLFGGVNKKGILLEGPPGTGKTLLARATANELGYSFHEISGSSFVEVFVGTGAQRVRELFDAARHSAPSLIFIDEIDAVAAADRNESSSNGSLEYRQTLNELLTQMNSITHDSHILVMCATNTIAAVDEAFKAPHRFEIVTINLPTPAGRKATLQHYVNRLPRAEISEEALDVVVEKSRGFSQAQIKSLVNNSVQFAIADKEAKQVTDLHIIAALEQARNAMKTGMFGSKSMEYDKVSFDDIAGLKEVVHEFEFLVHSLKRPDHLRSFGVTPPKGILLAGKPGTGKTLMVRALANEAECQVLYASGSSFDGKFMGDGAKEVRKLFDKARMISPAIIFIDEIDAISTRTGGQQTVNELLTQMDGFSKANDVIVIGATNMLHEVDYRLRREGRFSRIIQINTPNDEERHAIFKLYVEKLPKVNRETVPYDQLVLHTKGFSGAGLRTIVNDAAMTACKLDAEQVEAEHFNVALTRALRDRKQRGQ